MTIEQIREVLNSIDPLELPKVVAQNIVDSIVAIRTDAYNEGWDDRDKANPAPTTDTNAIDELVNFVRTPEWSVSMLEDIAVIVQEARPDIGEPFDADDDRAWRPH